MREIKFRAWYPDEYRMEYQDGKTPLWLGDILTDSYYIPMQYVGLKDSKDARIYEGDIIKYRWWVFGKKQEVIGSVEYDAPQYMVRIISPKEIAGKTRDWVVCCMNKEELEIIGNIYEMSVSGK